ncbi:MAG: rhomboid family intramembrane serine protease [Parachlamydiales bacterium]|jgi:membrane associated rhomboid family serine protease
MIPLGDDNSSRKSIPVVTYALIAINILFFLLEMAGGEAFIKEWAFIPSRFLANPAANFLTIFTAMFMHAGWGHLIGNMIYLWIFGDNVEDRFGKGKYIFFYLLSGIAATFSQLVFNPESNVPNVGASGAIAGVLGAYILFFPRERVKILIGQYITDLPALVVIGFWFFLQFISGFSTSSTSADTGGVAYMAHVGGFIAGLAVAGIFKVFETRSVR